MPNMHTTNQPLYMCVCDVVQRSEGMLMRTLCILNTASCHAIRLVYFWCVATIKHERELWCDISQNTKRDIKNGFHKSSHIS